MRLDEAGSKRWWGCCQLAEGTRWARPRGARALTGSWTQGSSASASGIHDPAADQKDGLKCAAPPPRTDLPFVIGWGPEARISWASQVISATLKVGQCRLRYDRKQGCEGLGAAFPVSWPWGDLRNLSRELEIDLTGAKTGSLICGDHKDPVRSSRG